MNVPPEPLLDALRAQLPVEGARLVVALSGGADSSSLLAAASVLRDTGEGWQLRAVHVDHGLQAAAAEFCAACRVQCELLRVPLTVLRVEVDAQPGVSLEAAARDSRYAALEADLEPGECLLTAHHARDQAETLLLQAVRGAGLKGLSAMPVCRKFGPGWHLRPLLNVPQSVLLQYGAKFALECAADPMNDDPRFDRNYLRRRVWPALEERWPGVGNSLTRTARHVAEAQELLQQSACADLIRLRDGEALSVPALRALPRLRRFNAVRQWLSESGVQPPSTARLAEALRQVLEARTDHMPAVAWGEFALRRYRQRLFLTAASLARLQGAKSWQVGATQPLQLGNGLGTLVWALQPGGIDPKFAQLRLQVRARKGGETLKPHIKARTQSVQHLCQAQGVLPWMRDALPLLFAENDLIAVADLWLDARWCAAADARGGSLRGGEPQGGSPRGAQTQRGPSPGFALTWLQAPIIV
jgi:tRNA(Ile)-lysidine synthase